MDVLTAEQRSKNMAAIRSKNSKPEIVVRKLLHRLGFRFRLHRRDLPGCPDLVLPKYKTVIFVNGCFWHQHANCKHSHIPQTRVDYWSAKLNATVERDQRNIKDLARLGWRTIVVWECQLKHMEEIATQLKAIPEIHSVSRHQQGLVLAGHV